MNAREPIQYDGRPMRGETVMPWGLILPAVGILAAECGQASRDLRLADSVELSDGDRVCAKCRWPEEIARWIEADPALASAGITRPYYRPRPVLDTPDT